MKTMLTRNDMLEMKAELLREIREALDNTGKDLKKKGLAVDRSCIHAAVTFCRRFAEYGCPVPPTIQAGSASWRTVRESEDDGVMDTHYSFIYELGQKATVERLAAYIGAITTGKLPEIHAWVVIPAINAVSHVQTDDQPEFWRLGGYVVDFGAAFIKARAVAEGKPWTAPDPVDIMKVDDAALAAGKGYTFKGADPDQEAVYEPVDDACCLVAALVEHYYGIKLLPKSPDALADHIQKRVQKMAHDQDARDFLRGLVVRHLPRRKSRAS